MPKNIDHKNGEKQKTNKGELFSDIDAKSVETSGYTMGRGAPQNDDSMQEHSIPTGVVDIDESVVLPSIYSDSNHQPDLKAYKILRPSQTNKKEHVYLPPITHHQPYSYYPPGYFNMPPICPYCAHLYNSYATQYSHQSFHHHHPHHHTQHHDPHHHHHHHRHHHRHQKHRKTYDPRWWYMPLNSVHGPKSRQPDYKHYIPPKWYEVPNR